MRRRIFEIIEKAQDNDNLSHFYDIFMIVVIIISLIPLAFKTNYPVFIIIDKIAAGLFIVDYLLRWITADYLYNHKSVVSFMRYPFSVMAIIDLVSILPSLSVISKGFKVLRVLRMIRALRVLRVFKGLRYSKNFQIMGIASSHFQNRLRQALL